MMARPFNKRFLGWLKTFAVYLIIFVIGGFLGNLWMTRDQAAGPAPEIVGPNLEAQLQRIDLSDPNSPRLLYFFAEWCPICRAQNSVINNIHSSVPVLGIAMQSGTTQRVRRYAGEQELAFPVVNDESGQISRAYGVNGVPAVFILDSRGQIAFSTRGYATELGLRSRLWLTRE